MRKVQVSNGTCDTPTTNRSVDTDNDSDEVLTHAATESQCVPKSYIHWCYHPSTDWILWYLVSKLPKEEDGRISDVGLTPARVDSGIGLHLLGHEDGHLSPTAASTPSTPITLSFHFKDGTTTKLLDYRVYSQWANVNSLLNELAQDGIVIDELWDVNEDMPIVHDELDEFSEGNKKRAYMVVHSMEAKSRKDRAREKGSIG
ncbi:hypothetical protein J4E83_010523 [Alternaria metachromatica]|uniref:uncharacterized protein n=1 Tax=Alternaria metachromatica TaxID=283354 RepID=UPI0020C1E3DB|nr:uncharacterized protein J4E83_010523 [Alternaria metachromatica]KAI4605631.1 hypothetical protein J4E83_010523 [Alternaria metachromatica]